MIDRIMCNQYVPLDDLCLVMVKINNENSLFNQNHNGAIDKLPEHYASEFQKQWNKWLHEHYKPAGELSQTWDMDKSKPIENFT